MNRIDKNVGFQIRQIPIQIRGLVGDRVSSKTWNEIWIRIMLRVDIKQIRSQMDDPD